MGAPPLFLVCDGGGSNTRALLFSKEGMIGRGLAGASNPSDAGVDFAVRNITLAFYRALQDAQLLQQPEAATDGPTEALLSAFPLSGCWCALSGLDTPQGEAAMSKRLRTALALTQDCLLRCGNDCELLTGCIKETEKGVAVIAGTGSVGMAGQKGKRGQAAVVTIGRAGGYGFLLGDEGSGFHVGKEAIRQLLDVWDAHMAHPDTVPLPSGPLLPLTLKWFNAPSLSELLLSVYRQDSSEHERKKKIAGLCGVVMDCAFPKINSPTAGPDFDPLALKAVEIASHGLVGLIARLVREHDIQPAQASLVLGGGAIAANPGYKEAVLEACRNRFGEDWAHVVVVEDPGLQGGLIQAAKFFEEASPQPL